jgi:hypothetical protein
VASGSFLKHSGTPSCPSFASGSSGHRLIPDTTYNYSATASNNGINFSATLSFKTPASSWTPPANVSTPIYDDTYTRICLPQNWTDCGSWTIYDAVGTVVNRLVGPVPFTICQTSGVNVCSGTPKGYAVLTGRYYAPVPTPPAPATGVATTASIDAYALNGQVIPQGRGGSWEIKTFDRSENYLQGAVARATTGAPSINARSFFKSRGESAGSSIPDSWQALFEVTNGAPSGTIYKIYWLIREVSGITREYVSEGFSVG